MSGFTHHRKDCAAYRILLVLRYPTAIILYAHCRRRYLSFPLGQPPCLFHPVISRSDKEGGLFAVGTHHARNSRRRSARRLLGNSCTDTRLASRDSPPSRALAERLRLSAGDESTLGTHPLVKTFSKEVLPQAPSPLMFCMPSSANCRCHDMILSLCPPRVVTHSSTSLRWTVLLPPSPQGMISERSGRRWRIRDRPRDWIWERLVKERESRLRRNVDSIVSDGCE